MDKRKVKIGNTFIEEDLLVDFLYTLSKQLNTARIEEFFNKFIYGTVKALDVFNIEYDKKEGSRLEKVNISLNKRVDVLEKLVKERDDDIGDLMYVVRHYEDFLNGYGMRNQIVNRKDFPKILEEDEEGWTA